MKRIFFVGLLLLSATMLSCLHESPEARAVDEVKMTLSYSGEMFQSETPAVGKAVVLRSALREYRAVTDAQGVATFSGVIPDTYNVSSTGFLTPQERMHMVDPPALGIKVMTNGVIGSLNIFDNLQGAMDMKVGVESNIIISKVYFTGCKDDNNKNYQTDMYVEFYNNSDEEVSTENLYFALLDTESNDAFVSDKENNVYGKDVYQFPTRTLAPGASIVFAREARNHTVGAIASVDLSDADYQTKASKGSPGPNTPEMPNIYRTFPTLDYLVFVMRGGNGMVLFKTADNPADFAKVGPNPSKPLLNPALKIPANTILDGVETLPYKDPVEITKKRLSDRFDGSYIVLPAAYQAAYCSISFERKVVDTTESGRKVLKDTNNSLADFAMVKDNLTPRDYDKQELYAQ